MKKNFLYLNIGLLMIIFISISRPGFAQLTVAANTYLVTSGNTTQIVLQDVNLVNNGTINHTSGNIKFTGTAINSISGNGTLSLYNLEVNKTANSVSLSRNISVKNQIQFTAGILNLNAYNIDLGATGSLENENENSRITSSGIGVVKSTKVLNAPVEANPGNLGAVITSTENLGSVTIQRGHQSQINSQGTGNSILRFYEITPTNNASLKATLRFKYFDAELNAIPEADLVLFKGSAGGSWDERGYTTRDAATNFVEKINLPDFSRWTLSNAGNVLASGCPDGEALTYYADADGDGYGNPNSTITSCVPQAGFIANKTDCNDANAAIHPGAVEVCDGVDNDCDGVVDEGVQTIYYADADGDGYGSNTVSTNACSSPQGYVTINGDCNDNNPAVNPGVTEICGNIIDDNCNGQIDEGCNTTTPSLSINDQNVFESQGTAQLTVSLSAPSATTVSVKYKTLNGTAVQPKDYTRLSGELVFAPGETTKTISIQIKSDNVSEPAEWFDVELNTPQNATISDGLGRVTISESLMTINKNSVTPENGYFRVQAYRNPTHSYFELQIASSDNSRIKLMVRDVLGRLVETMERGVSTIRIGNTYRPGIYFAEVQQGANRKVIKLIKH